MQKKLVKYVKENLHKGYSAAEISEKLKQHGYDDEEIQEVLVEEAHTHQHIARTRLVMTGFVALLILGIIFYLFVLSPAGVEKPYVEKPGILPVEERTIVESTWTGSRVPADQVLVSEQMLVEEPVSIEEAVKEVAEQIRQTIPPSVDETHLAYVLTELGAYKLHKNPFTGELPEIEIIITDTEQIFSAVIQDNEVVVVSGNAKSPDARISVDSYAVLELVGAENDEFKMRASELFNERDQRGYTGELVAGKAELLLKGYMGLYDEAKELGSPTGSVIEEVELAGSQVIGAFFIIVILWGSLILRMVLHR